MSLKSFSQSVEIAKRLLATAEETGHEYKPLGKSDAEGAAELMARLASIDDPEFVEKVATALIKARDNAAPTIELWTHICLNVNWLSWAWAPDNEEMSKAWADQWYRINDYSFKTLKGDDLSYYIKTTD